MTAVDAVARAHEALFEAYNGPQRGLLLAPVAQLLLYDQD